MASRTLFIYFVGLNNFNWGMHNIEGAFGTLGTYYNKKQRNKIKWAIHIKEKHIYKRKNMENRGNSVFIDLYTHTPKKREILICNKLPCT